MDLDETLGTADSHFYEMDEDLNEFANDAKGLEFFNRPYLEQFLRGMSRYYELVIFTAAEEMFADTILDKLDTNRLNYNKI